MTKAVDSIAVIVAATSGCGVYDAGTTTDLATRTDDGTTQSSMGSNSEDSVESSNAESTTLLTASSGSATGDASADAASSSGDGTDSSTTSFDPGTSGSSSTSDSRPGCGDDMISPGEQCDGADLQGFTCMALGLNGGTLACDPVTCTFDTSMCMSTSGGTSG